MTGVTLTLEERQFLELCQFEDGQPHSRPRSGNLVRRGFIGHNGVRGSGLYVILPLGRAALDAYRKEHDEGTGAREAEGSRLLSGSASDGHAGSNPAPSAHVLLHPPYRYVVSEHGPATVYDAIDVGWIARVKESLPHKAELARIITDALNAASSTTGQDRPL